MSFWIQIHKLPVHCMTTEVRDSIGSSIGSLLQTTETEEKGNKGSYLRVRVRVDISKPLSKVRKIWLENRVIGWAALKYEHLPNFCYRCGLVSHDNRDCEKWLGSKGTLRKEDQQYREWLRAENDFSTRRTLISVPSSRQNYTGPNQRKDYYPKHQQEGDTKEGRKNESRSSKLSLIVVMQEKLGPNWNPAHKESLNENVMMSDFEETL